MATNAWKGKEKEGVERKKAPTTEVMRAFSSLRDESIREAVHN